MKTTLTSFALCIILLMSATIVHAQNTIALLKYADAEKAYNAKNYTQCLALLDETEELLGQANPKTSYLRIMAINADILILDSFDELQKFYDQVDNYLKNYDIPGLEEKYKQVYEVQKAIHGGNIGYYPKEKSNYFNMKGNRVVNTQRYAEALTWYKKAAAVGNEFSMNTIGNMYHRGLGVTRNDAEAFVWYKKAAEAGHTWAQYNLAGLYETGSGTTQNYNQAFAWYQKSADGNDVLAYTALGRFYEKGLGVPQNYKAALAWYQKGAYVNSYYNSTSAFKIAYFYEKGLGVEADKAKAVDLYTKLNKRISSDGLRKDKDNWISKDTYKQRAYIYYEGGAGVEKDYTKAFEFAGPAQTYIDDKKTYYFNQPEKMIKQRNDEMLKLRGDIYFEGGHGKPKNYYAASIWYEDLLKSDSLYFKYYAADKLGYMYSANDRSLSLNFKLALKYYTMLEDAPGYGYGKFKTGILYYEGKGTAQNYNKALHWFQKSDWPAPQIGLMFMYYTGHGVEKDRDKAERMYRALKQKKPRFETTAFFKSFERDVQKGRYYDAYFPVFAKDARSFLKHVK